MFRAIVALSCVIFFFEHAFTQDDDKYLNKVGKYRDVMTEAGVVRGRIAEDGDYFTFLGIPYAAPPTGTNRFKVRILNNLFSLR